ncbi:MAG: tRNA (adenosine(37)-N6)-threonylcarbamoyltransferase complex transferase subunit TsaD [Candidatus Pacebacteria bacterium]|nr:tRNA (adenosine(37)-N6)-threonylcarbamoyltransferase complex transferase subunit TsaD [Candidatus Paceibacterota bacterium]
MKILAIETSCDETAVSIVECRGDLESPSFSVLAHQVSSQVALHAPYGGVVPNIAKREHLKNLPVVLAQALAEAGLTESSAQEVIEAVAVTVGPGLEPALWTGIEFAKDLAQKWNKPLIPTNHLEGHVISPLLEGKEISLPAMALVASGGHTELVLVKNLGEYEKVGATKDDAAGEAFDKVARLLGLAYPGGPNLSKLAETVTKQDTWILPRPMLNSKDYNFSFSGLKTAVLYAKNNYEKEKSRELNDEEKAELAFEFEQAVVEVLLTKTLKAAEQYGANTIILGGGVIANQRLRAAFEVKSEEGFNLLIPNFNLATDNATMIAMASYIRYLKNDFISPSAIPSSNISANGNLNF